MSNETVETKVRKTRVCKKVPFVVEFRCDETEPWSPTDAQWYDTKLEAQKAAGEYEVSRADDDERDQQYRIIRVVAGPFTFKKQIKTKVVPMDV